MRWSSFSGGSSGRDHPTNQSLQCINNVDCAEDSTYYQNYGPIPIGNYTIVINDSRGYIRGTAGSVGQAVGRTFGVVDDWGSFYFPIYNIGKGHTRNGFFLHGGDSPGSAGCIDFGGGSFGNSNTKNIIGILQNDSDGKIALTVTK